MKNKANLSVGISIRQKHCFLFFEVITVLIIEKKGDRKGFQYSEGKFASCQRPKNGLKIG